MISMETGSVFNFKFFSNSQVTVDVTDVNDNAPRFLLPVQNDDDDGGGAATTLYVSPYCPSGHVFYRLSAVDPDRSGGPVEFHLTSSDYGPFYVDQKTGSVAVVSSGATINGSFDARRPLSSESDGRQFTLRVAAVDVGGLATSVRFNVVVNRSAIIDMRFGSTSQLTADGDPNGGFAAAAGRRRSLVVGLHVTVVASVVAVSAVTTIGLLVAILIVVVSRRRRNRKRKYCVASSSSSSPAMRQYNCRTAAEEASARMRGLYNGVPSSLGLDDRSSGTATPSTSLPPSSSMVTSCAWYSSPAEMGPGDGYCDYRSATIGGGRTKMKDGSSSSGGGGGSRTSRREEVNRSATINRAGRRSPFSSPKVCLCVCGFLGCFLFFAWLGSRQLTVLEGLTVGHSSRFHTDGRTQLSGA
jgi:hypothetical protein